MKKRTRCAIYTRKSSEAGLEQEFNSLDAQREACEAFIKSQRGLGWVTLSTQYNDGGLSGGTMDRPALLLLLSDIDKGKVDLVVVYKVDRLTRSLMDFVRIVETLEAKSVSFVSVTQQFNTANSMGRLTLNVLLSFAQFEREVTAERIRDKIAASKKKGLWMGGLAPLGYDAVDKKLVVNEAEAKVVRTLFDLYLELGSVRRLKEEADSRMLVTKQRRSGERITGGQPFSRGHLYQLLHNPVYAGRVAHKGQTYPGRHDAIVECTTWDAVQERLDANGVRRRSPMNGRQISFLTGVVYDGAGERLCPTHATKRGRRYRYYISKRLVHDERKSYDDWRLPARELERAVERCICGFLEDEPSLIEAVQLSSGSPDEICRVIRAASRLAAKITGGSTAHDVGDLRKLIHRVDLNAGQIRIDISRRGLWELIGTGDRLPDDDDTPISLELPIAFRRRGVECKIVLPASGGFIGADDNLIALVARTKRWFDRIAKGEVTSVRVIARQEDTDEGDVSRFLPLAFLAPDIVEAILAGKQPPELTAEILKRLRFLPHDWQEQRESLGFQS